MVSACSPNDSLNDNDALETTSLKNNTTEVYYWLNSYKVACTGVAEKKCLQIQKGEHKQTNQWQLFYDEIEGFVYEEGYSYQLLVREEQLETDNIPADASSIKYTLVKILAKKEVEKVNLNGVWLLSHIQDKAIDANGYRKTPQLLIVTENMSISGNDSCNSLFSSIKTLTADKMVLGFVGTTKMLCSDMTVADLLYKNLENIIHYQVKNNQLILFDDQHNQLLRFTRKL